MAAFEQVNSGTRTRFWRAYPIGQRKKVRKGACDLSRGDRIGHGRLVLAYRLVRIAIDLGWFNRPSRYSLTTCRAPRGRGVASMVTDYADNGRTVDRRKSEAQASIRPPSVGLCAFFFGHGLQDRAPQPQQFGIAIAERFAFGRAVNLGFRRLLTFHARCTTQYQGMRIAMEPRNCSCFYKIP